MSILKLSEVLTLLSVTDKYLNLTDSVCVFVCGL